MDGIEIPNINHFATQGATGGPVSIVNADLVREISFYTGLPGRSGRGDEFGAELPTARRQCRKVRPSKATLGASEVGLSGSGHIGRKTTLPLSRCGSPTCNCSSRLLGLPFLPNYIDGQVKVKTRLSERDELTVLGLAGIDNMRLNVDEEGEDAEYMLSYLPRIQQETFLPSEPRGATMPGGMCRP